MFHLSNFALSLIFAYVLVNEGNSKAPPAGSCGLNKYADVAAVPYIIGGQDALPNEFPYQVSLRRPGSHSCGGSIINKNWILTAAHCFVSIPNPDSWQVVVGKHTIDKAEPASEITYRVVEIRPHEEFNVFLSNKNDVAVVKIAGEMPFSEYIQPVCLAAKGYALAPNGEPVTVTGWGVTAEGGNLSNVLQKLTIPTIDNDRCQMAFPREFIYSTMLCAGGDKNGGKDACQGDSGGPLVHRNANGSFIQVGITSWGYGCGKASKPGVYTRVSEMIDWIQKNAV